MIGPRPRLALMVVAAAALAICAAPAVASAACALPSGPATSLSYEPAQNFSGSFPAARQGDFVQIRFQVPTGATGIRVRYCYDSGSTLDIGVYEPVQGSASAAGSSERRGWSGSAVRDFAISRNGFSPPAIYESDRKAFVEGYTTRAYLPGAIPAGTWTAELGLAALGNPSVDWQLRVETSSDPAWASDPYSPAPYDAGAARSGAAWYAGDVHAHGEQEPGNALMSASFDYAFTPLSEGGAGLDFLGLVDHNNDVNRGEIGKYQASYPGRLIIPGTEVTTYHGHYNNIGSNHFADFRGGSVYRWDQAGQTTTKVEDAVTPASQLPGIDAGGGWAQINHPTIFPSSNPGNVSLCRGCPWDWTPAETDYSRVDAIEIQTGPADLGTVQNPFTPTAIAFYEQQLATGAHIAAVGSSDSHQAGEGDITSAPIGQATTEVYAGELSAAAIVAGIEGDHTYVKPYGNDGPDIRVTGRAPGAPHAIIGDTLTGPSARFDVDVLRAGPAAARPGAYRVDLLENGVAIDSATVTGDDFSHRFAAAGPGRYSVEVLRLEPDANRIEVYSSPIWFERGKNLRVGKLKRNKRRGTAKLTVAVSGPGALRLGGKDLRTARKTTSAAGKVRLALRPNGKLNRKLRRQGKVRVKAQIRFTPDDGDRATTSEKVKLKRRRDKG